MKAYCHEDGALLCINCILEDGHQHHTLTSIEDAAEIEKRKFSDLVGQAEAMENELELLLRQTSEHLSR